MKSIRSTVGLATIAIASTLALCLTACEGTYQKDTKKYHYHSNPDGSFDIEEEETHEQFKLKGEAVKQIIVGSRSTAETYYYVLTLSRGDTGEKLGVWKAATFNELDSEMPEMLKAAGYSYSQQDFSDLEHFVSSNWISPADWYAMTH